MGIPRSTQFKGHGHSCMLVFRRTSHAKRIKSQVGCNQPCSWNRGFSTSSGTWLGNLMSKSNTRFPIMFLELWIFTLTKNMVGNIFCSQYVIPPVPWTQKWWCHGDSKLGAMLVFCRTSHAKCKKGLALNEVSPLQTVT